MTDNVLTKGQKNYIAWKETLKDLLQGISIIVIFMGMIYGLYLLVTLVIELDLVFAILQWGALIVLIFIFLLFMYLHKEQKLEMLFDCKYRWQPNIGSIPVCNRVSIEFKNGRKMWNIDPKDCNWKLTVKIPIKEYRILPIKKETA